MVLDVAVYFTGALAAAFAVTRDQPWRRTAALYTLLLFQPGLIVIDHGHFQVCGTAHEHSMVEMGVGKVGLLQPLLVLSLCPP
jgi:ALG6/ALG8 glycosyltransferase family protein